MAFSAAGLFDIMNRLPTMQCASSPPTVQFCCDKILTSGYDEVLISDRLCRACLYMTSFMLSCLKTFRLKEL